MSSCLGERFHPLVDIQHVLGEFEPAALFENRNQFVKFRPGVRTSDYDPNGVEQFLPLRSGLSALLLTGTLLSAAPLSAHPSAADCRWLQSRHT